MRNIAVLIYDLTVEYQITVVDGILKYFRDMRDVSVFIAPVNTPHATTYDYDYQYWTSVEVLNNKQIDAFIVVPNSFTAVMSVSRLSAELKKIRDVPVISVAVPLDIPNNSYSCISSKKAYADVIEHLIEKHNRSKFAFVSAELDGSPEGEERLESFKAALKKHNMEFHQEWVFPGDFTPATTNKLIKEKFANETRLPFDAIICANDYMALGAQGALMELGFKVPEDVCVIGFDNASVATDVAPTLSTIEQHVMDSGAKAAELADKASLGKKIPKKVYSECFPIYRQSCGCIREERLSASYYDQTGTYFDRPRLHGNVLNLFGNALSDLASIYHMISMTDSVTDLTAFYASLTKTLKMLYINKMVICLYENEIELKPEDDFVRPDKVKEFFHYDNAVGFEKDYFDIGGVPFNPNDTFISPESPELYKNNYYVVPISLQNINYGYMICSLPMNKYTVYEVYLKIFSNAFIHSYNYTCQIRANNRLVETNRNLNVQNRTDELTKVFNRRGFFEYAQRLIDLSNVTGTTGCVFFFDMDGLKTINDNWGHKTGDIAIQTIAEVLKDAFHKSDLVGRLSGDEFAALAPGFQKENIDIIRERIEVLSKDYSEKNELPFIVSASMGVVEYNTQRSLIQGLLLDADREMYVEKKHKHESRS